MGVSIRSSLPELLLRGGFYAIFAAGNFLFFFLLSQLIPCGDRWPDAILKAIFKDHFATVPSSPLDGTLEV